MKKTTRHTQNSNKKKAIHEQGRKPKQFLIHAEPGMGKTYFNAELIHQLLSEK